uniref:uncharacterized protein LOC122590893 isoform X2 n=1 Tax=Erigeron canadensis TaxID=72917 RepID=UPI001CB961AB|nr:uncharacterized protein LOC122590893 isoform X2 [Erigeron canadensis]
MKEASRSSKNQAQLTSGDSDSESESSTDNSEVSSSDNSSSSENRKDVKKSELDVFEFDEYDDDDGFEYASSIKNKISAANNKWKDLFSPKLESPRAKNDKNDTVIATSPSPVKMDIDNDDDDEEADMTLSVWTKKYRASSGKRVKSVEKNGIVEVTVSKNSDSEEKKSSSDHGQETELIVPSKMQKAGALLTESSDDHAQETETIVPQQIVASLTKSSDDQTQETKPIILYKKRSRRDGHVSTPEDSVKKQVDIGTPVLTKRKDQSSDKSSRKRKRVKNEGFVKELTEEDTESKGKGSEVKASGGTEKQILREKIKDMLLAANWTIDYRPRRNKSYMDAVYISPAGTGYWSIVKAYDAFQKEKEDDIEDGSGFTPLRDEVLGKLTRQTQKKKQREMRKKRKYEDADDSDSYKEEKSGRKSRKIGRGTLLVRGSDKGSNLENGFEAYSGKRTLLSWLVDSGVVHMNEDAKYMNPRKTRAMQKGSITKEGINCGCCSEVVTVFKFEEHAGSKLRQPFLNIFLESGKSLMQCQIDAWNKLGELEQTGFYNVDVDGDDPNDDTCGICGDGGDLICCDGCPSTFHQSCLDIQMLPQGDWLCLNCCCKYCDGICTEVDGKTKDSLLACRLCQKKYHESCRPEIDDKPIKSNYMSSSFCGSKCHELYDHLQKLVRVKHELDSEFSWSLIHRSDISIEAPPVELSQRVEYNSMLAVAMSVMDECFLPFTDRRSGTNLIRNVVFTCGSNLSRLNYSGFYTAILERGDEVVCAASIRIHGTQLAEMPFIGTRHLYRRQGMCSRLLSAIESALSSLQVEKLIIPAIAEHMNTWTDVFGFHPLEESHKQELKSLNMVVFPGTDMLQKPLVKQDAPDIVKVDYIKDMSEKKSDLISSEENDISDETHNADSGSGEQSVPLDDGCAIETSEEMLPRNSPGKDHGIPCEPKLMISVDAHIESATNDSTVMEANKITPEVQLSGKKSVSANSHMHTNVEETTAQNGDGSNLLPVQMDVHPDTNVEETNVQTGDGLSLLPTQVDVHPDTNVEETNVQTGDGLSLLPTQVDVHQDTNVEETNVQAGDGVSLLPIQVDVHPDTNVVETNVQTGDGVSLVPTQVDVHQDTNVEETSLQNCDASDQLATVVDVDIVTNVEKTSVQTGKRSILFPTQVDVHPDTNGEENGVQTVDESNLLPSQVDVHPNTKVEETNVQTADGSNLLSTQVDVHPDTNLEVNSVQKTDVCPDTNVEEISDGSNLLPNKVVVHPGIDVEETSVQKTDVHLDTNIEETSVPTGDGSIVLPTQVDLCPNTNVEEASLQKTDVHSEENVKEASLQTGDGSNLLPCKVDVHPDTNSVKTSVQQQIDLHPDTNLEEASVQTGNGSNLLSTQVDVNHETNVEETGVRQTDVHTNTNVEETIVQTGDGSNQVSTQVDVHTETGVEEAALQTGDRSNLVSTQVDVHTDSTVEKVNVQINGTVSSKLLCERDVESSRMESFSMEAHVAVRVDESSADVKPVIPETGNYAEKEKVLLSAGKEGSCES